MVFQQLGCGAMLKQCSVQMASFETTNQPLSGQTSDVSSCPVHGSPTWEVYIPAPEHSSREAAFQWHLTTRNFFAFLFNKPLVGSRLGTSLINLQERIQL